MEDKGGQCAIPSIVRRSVPVPNTAMRPNKALVIHRDRKGGGVGPKQLGAFDTVCPTEGAIPPRPRRHACAVPATDNKYFQTTGKP